MGIRPKNWDSFQHYKNRRPPWIKLHHTLVDDVNFHALKGEDAKFLVMIWLIASEDFGKLPPVAELAFRLRMPIKQAEQLLARLKAWFESDASKPLARVEQVATPEGEAEADEERKAEGEAQAPPQPGPDKTTGKGTDFHFGERSEIPEGLAIVQYAAFVCEQAHIPASYGLKVKVGDAIRMLAVMDKCSEARATALMVPRMVEAQKQGEKINFWLDDGGWKTDIEVKNGSHPSITRQRVDSGIGAVAKYLAARGVGAPGSAGGADGAAIPESGARTVARGVPVGLREAGGEALAPESRGRAGGAENPPRAEVLPKAR